MPLQSRSSVAPTTFRRGAAQAPPPDPEASPLRTAGPTGGAGLASFSVGLVTAIAGEIPSLDPSRIHNQTDGFIYANNGRVLSVLRGSQSRILLRSDQISPLMKQAIVAIEDKRFYEHRGVDVRGIVRALWADMRGGGAVQGGSTITQQFVKNTYTNNQRSIARKLREAALAWQLEQRWSK